MSQNDFTIANQGFPAFRADLNSALQALATNNSGTSAPSTTFANMWWYDSANNIMYIRNEDNDAWIKFAELDQTNDKFVLSGTLQLDDGSASAPALTFNSDTNMGIYRGGTDILKLVTAGTDAVTIDASQNVGIGTTSPSSYYAKDLVLSADNQGGITIVGGTSDTGQYLAFADGTSGSDRFRGYLQYAHDTNNMLFATDGSEAMRIDSSGRVMIGNTTEGVAGADELTVGNTSGGHGITIRSGTSNNGALYFSDGTSGASEYDGGFEYNHGSQFMRFISAGSERMRIDSSGNLLVGATSTNTGAFGAISPQILVAGTLPQVALHETDTDKDGYIGISSSTMFIQTADAIPIRFGTSDAERMRIDSSGNLLVGITSTSGTTGMYVTQSGDTVIKSANANSSQARFQWSSPVFDSGSATKHGLELYNGTDVFEIGYISDSGGSQGAFMDISGTDLGLIIRSDNNGVRLANGATSFSSYSDSRLKDVTGVIPNALEKIDAMRGVLYSWNDDEENTQRCGVIAQEVQAVLPEVIDDDTDYLQVRYSEMIPLLIEGIKEQQATIEALTARIVTLENA